VVSGGLNPKLIKSDPKLYNCPFPTLIAAITSCPEEGSRLALIGHNPGISQAAALLAQSGHYQLDTSGAVCLQFQANSWSEIKEGTGSEVWYYQPN
jgi:phosphohistidine phosphatase